MHIIYIYTYHHQRWISNKCRLYKCSNDYFEHRNDRCRKIYFYTENKWKEKERVGHGFCFILAQIQGCTRSRERRLARSEIQPPTTFTSGRKRKKKGEGDRDESIRAWRETETVNYRTGTRQSREPVGRTSSRINRAKSIVRYTCWKGWTVEQKKKEKKKETRAIKKPVSGLKSNYSSCLHSADIVAKRSTATRSGWSPENRRPFDDSVLSLMTIWRVFKTCLEYRRSSFLPFSLFLTFFFFLFFYYTTSSGVDRKYSVQPGERLSQACSFPNLFHWEWFGFGVDTKWRVEDAPYLGDKRGVIWICPILERELWSSGSLKPSARPCVHLDSEWREISLFDLIHDEFA